MLFLNSNGLNTAAVLLIVPVAPPATIALAVKVTLPPAGNAGMTMPAPCISATVVFAGVVEEIILVGFTGHRTKAGALARGDALNGWSGAGEEDGLEVG